MTNTGKNFVAVIITFLLVEVGFWLLNFHPRNDFPKYYGFVIDVSIWLVSYYLILWIIGKVVKPETETK